MQTLGRLTAPELAAVVTAYRDALRAHQATINRLNVFPVPDGDTGTNMALTMESVIAELASRPSDEMDSVLQAISYGSLMGARGNSGVILSQILRGLAESVRNSDSVDAQRFAEGLRRAAEGAYEAVQNPVEGTMLTVARAAADAAAKAIASGTDPSLVNVMDAARRGASDALDRTPELLPVLKAAGVVDAGGAGLALLLDSFLHVAAGRPVPEPPEIFAGDEELVPDREVGTGHPPGNLEEGLRYEVMYLLEAQDELIPAFRQVWAGIGGSIVVVGGEGLWNCHIHTDDIGAAVEAALDVGRPRQIRVTDLYEQVEEERWVRDAAGPEEVGESPEAPGCSVVAVCTGEGIGRIFRSLGVRHVVRGGQSMNPSTAEILEAIAACPSQEVIILPNNKNIVPVAEQAALHAAKPVRVIPTRGIQEGFAALLEFDPEGSAESNEALMSESAARVVAGEIAKAVRPSTCDAGPIAEGDSLGLSRLGIEVVSADMASAATGLLERLIDAEHHEIVTIIAGEGSSSAVTRRTTEWLAEHHPDISVEVHHGGQRLYPYLFSIE